MRPDTEPNIHAKRIMAGAMVLSVAVFAWHALFWLLHNFQTVAVGVGIFCVAAFVCYAIGTVTLDIAGGGV